MRSFLSLLFVTACGSSAFAAPPKTLKIGVLTWSDARAVYQIPRLKMMEQLKEEGFEAGRVEWILEDAQGNKDKAAELIRKLQAAGVDAYVAVGTNSAIPLAQAVHDKPIIITVVFDPVKAGIAKDWNGSGRNLTGSSSYVSLASFMQRMCRYFTGDYTIRKVAVPFTPGEKNSELQLAEIQSVEKPLGLQVIPVPLSTAQDVSRWLAQLRGKADLIMITGSNIVAAHSKEIIDAAIREKVLTATHLEDLASQGILLGLVPDLERMGRIAGKKLASVLRGGDPATIAIEAPLPKLVINEDTASKGHFVLPREVYEWAGKKPSVR